MAPLPSPSRWSAFDPLTWVLRAVLVSACLTLTACVSGTLESVHYDSGQLKEQGRVVEGKREGPWRTWYESGELRVTKHYVAGEARGALRTFYRNGRLKLETSVIGSRIVGRTREWHANGQLKSDRHARNGRPHGRSRTWHANGQLESEGQVVDGADDGVWRHWNKDGSLEFTETYRRGSSLRKRTWHTNGRVAGERMSKKYSYSPSQKLGVHERWIYWDEAGRKRSEGELLNGQRDGQWTFWKPDGTVDRALSGRYQQGKRIGL